MEKKNKILLRVAIVILVVTLITTLILSSVYAKYVSDATSPSATGRPAAFEVIMKSPRDDSIKVNFAADGEPGAPIGYTEVTRDYEFSVVTDKSEVASEYSLELIFSAKIADKIRQAREDRFEDGIWCDFEVYQGYKNANNEIEYTKRLEGIEIGLYNDNGEANKGQPMTWSCLEDLEPNKNPGDGDEESYYKFIMIFYNNTMMTEKTVDGVTMYNYDDYLLDSNGVEIKVTSKQVNPEYKGEHVNY